MILIEDDSAGTVKMHAENSEVIRLGNLLDRAAVYLVQISAFVFCRGSSDHCFFFLRIKLSFIDDNPHVVGYNSDHGDWPTKHGVPDRE